MRRDDFAPPRRKIIVREAIGAVFLSALATMGAALFVLSVLVVQGRL